MTLLYVNDDESHAGSDTTLRDAPFDGVRCARGASDVPDHWVWGLLVGIHDFSSWMGA